jgi:hypothetical protein
MTLNEKDSNVCARFQVLKAVSMKAVAFWNATPCSLVHDKGFLKESADSLSSVEE